MQRHVAAISVSVLGLLAGTASASAADWPEVKLSAKSAVPVCATPARLMAMVKARNAGLDKRFDVIAAEYKRHGETLGVRWDYAFFQMLHETGDLSFKTSGRGVKPEQNNFAGLGAASAGEAGERFPDVSTGARAHLEHVMIYAGLPVENPVAERTRKVQQWKVVKPVEGRPATFGDVVERWAPKAKPYHDAVTNAAKQFATEFCKTPDAQADRVAMASPPKGEVAPRATPKAEPTRQVEAPKVEMPVTPAKVAEVAPKVSGADLAKKAVDDGRTEGNNVRSALGAGLARANLPPVKILNDPGADQKPQATRTALPPAAQKAEQLAAVQKCRVWTASYGGDKALIIRSAKADTVNFTVLDVNAGQEKREAEAYIAAYAPGGKIEAEFANQTQALDKAFDLCPEG